MMATAKPLTVEKTKDYLLRALRERGADYVYERVGGGCVYTDPNTGNPSCLIGHMLHHHGVKVPLDLESKSASEVLSSLELLPDDMTADVIADAVDRAQEWQDAGATWQVAVESALDWLGYGLADIAQNEAESDE